MVRNYHSEHQGGLHHPSFMGFQDNCQNCHVEDIRQDADRRHELALAAETAPINLSDVHAVSAHLMSAHDHEHHMVAGESIESLREMHNKHHEDFADEYDARGGSATMGDEHFHNRED